MLYMIINVCNTCLHMMLYDCICIYICSDPRTQVTRQYPAHTYNPSSKESRDRFLGLTDFQPRDPTSKQ